MVVEYVLCLGIALIVSSLTVYLRDLQYILGIFVMALQYMTPVMYGVDMVENSGAGDWLISVSYTHLDVYKRQGWRTAG